RLRPGGAPGPADHHRSFPDRAGPATRPNARDDAPPVRAGGMHSGVPRPARRRRRGHGSRHRRDGGARAGRNLLMTIARRLAPLLLLLGACAKRAAALPRSVAPTDEGSWNTAP